MFRKATVWIPILVTAALLVSNPARAQVSDPAFACQRATSKVIAKTAKSQAACVTKCHQRARKGDTPFASCTGNYIDSELVACVFGTPKGLLAKGSAAIAKACTGPGHECPSCYQSSCSAGQYPTAATILQISDSRALLDNIHCTPASGTADGKCMDATAKAYAKYVAAVAKCHDGCRTRERKGTAAGSCSPPASDPDTVACVATVSSKTVNAIDKKCFVPPGAPPSCPGWPASGAGWVPAFDASFRQLGDDSGETYCVPPVCCTQGSLCSARASATACTNAGGTPFEGDFVCDGTGGCVPFPGTPGECCESAGICAITDPGLCASFLGSSRVPAAVCMPGDVQSCYATPRKLVFVTTGTTNGAMRGLAGADALCQSEAFTTNLPGTFKAWLSDGTTTAAARLTHATVPYKRVDGVIVADDWTDLTDGTLDAPIDRDVLGSPVGAVEVFTGTAANGGNGAFNCAAWTTMASLPLGSTGTTASAMASWTAAAFGSCDGARRLYCFEQ